MAPTTISAFPELGNAPAWALCLPASVPFPPKLFGMLLFAEQMGLDDVVSWLPHGRAFKIHDRDGFMTSVASRFVTAKNLRSVHRQMLHWGIQRINKGEDKDAWFHKNFVRGQPVLMNFMTRTKVKGKVQPTSAMPRFLPFLDGRPLSQELRSLSSRSFAGSLHRGSVTDRDRARSASYPGGITNAAKEVIEPLPFRGDQNMDPFDDNECTLSVEQMIHDLFPETDESTLFVDQMIHDLFPNSAADGLHRGAATHCNRPRRASCPGGITEPTSQMIEPSPFLGNHDTDPFDDGDVSLFIDQMIESSCADLEGISGWDV